MTIQSFIFYIKFLLKMSEKNTDRYMQNVYEEVFNHEYHTEANNELFNSLIPDGWDIIDNLLIIIENKRLIKHKEEGKTHLFNYYDNLSNDIKSKYVTYLILGLGNNKKSFNYVIYDSNKKETNLTIQDVHNNLQIKPKFDEKEIRNLNQYLYDNSITLSKSQKTLFIASVLICLKINENILNDYDDSCDSFLIADKMIDIINNYYEDPLFTINFHFIKKSLHNKHLYHIFSVIKNDIKCYGKDILNQFYSEFCIWDRNNDSKLGIVLTPDDIVDLMVTKTFDYYYQFNGKIINPSLIDFCTGTGSFLIKGSKFTNSLYGCEIGDERYSLAKCNFILNNLNCSNLKYNSCFNEKYESNYFDVSIINPPFSNKCQDELNPNNKTNWKSYTKEQRFIMYQVELLREGGIGCCIVPRNNFNNNIKANNEFKKKLMNYCQILEVITCNNKVFVPNANVECTILIFRKYNNCEIDNLNNDKSNDYQTKIIDYSDDGFKIKKNIRYYDHKPVIKEQLRVLKPNDDWNYQNLLNDITDKILIQMINEYNNNYNYALNKYIINKNIQHDEYNNLVFKTFIEFNKVYHWKLFRIGDLIELVNVKKRFKVDESEKGIYPLITRTSKDNGITKFINDYSIDFNCFTIAPSGSVGYCFYHEYFIGVDGIIKVFKLKDININPHLIAMIITNTLTNKYSYTNGLTIDKILNETVSIPIFE